MSKRSNQVPKIVVLWPTPVALWPQNGTIDVDNRRNEYQSHGQSPIPVLSSQQSSRTTAVSTSASPQPPSSVRGTTSTIAPHTVYDYGQTDDESDSVDEVVDLDAGDANMDVDDSADAERLSDQALSTLEDSPSPSPHVGSLESHLGQSTSGASISAPVTPSHFAPQPQAGAGPSFPDYEYLAPWASVHPPRILPTKAEMANPEDRSPMHIMLQSVYAQYLSGAVSFYPTDLPSNTGLSQAGRKSSKSKRGN